MSAIIERGFVAHWLVCGPFASDVEGGIATALREGRPALGNADLMQPLGGIQRLRPKHLDRVKTPQGDAIWQRAGAKGPALDLGPFFPEAAEGIAYAGFHTQTAAEQQALIEVQSHLGARVYFNGSLLREIPNAVFPAGGVDVFPVTFPAGTSFLVLEVPGLRHEGLAEFLGTTASTVRERHLGGRPLLTGASGFEIGLKIYPVEHLGNMLYVPKLVPSGRLAREGGGARPTGEVMVYNAAETTSQPVQVVARAGNESTAAVVPPIAPGQFVRVDVAIPTGTTEVAVALSMGDTRADFEGAPAPELPVRDGGTVYFLSGVYREGPRGDAGDLVDSYRTSLGRNVQLLGEPEFGFDLGPALLWSPAVQSNANLRLHLAQALVDLRTAPHLEMAPLDERLVGDEVIARNLLYGYRLAEGLLETTGQVFYAWRIPALAPQSPQLIQSAHGTGVLSTMEAGGLPPLFAHLALNGSSLPHRRKTAAPGPVSLDELRTMADTQRQEVWAAGIESDALVNESASPPPESFLLGAAAPLAKGVPSIRLSSAGAHDFFRTAGEALAQGKSSMPAQARMTTRVNLGEVIAQPALKAAYAETERLVVLAERTATAAGLLGAEYPGQSMDRAWRLLIAHGSPDMLGFAETESAATELLGACRESADAARAVLDNSLAYIAGQVDTLGGAPLRNEQVKAVVVFNPSPWPRTDLCELHVRDLGAPSFTIVDDSGAGVACDVTEEPAPPGHPERLLGRFVAREVPGFGWRTFYLIPQQKRVERLKSDALQIENEYFWVTAEPDSGGAITSVVDKYTGREWSAGLWNDVVLLPEGDNNGGRALWTNGEPERASALHAAVEVSKHAAMQEIRVSAEMAGATIVRTIRLYPGVSRIDCELHAEGLALKGKLLAIASDINPSGRVPIFGERFGAVVGRKSAGSFDFRARDAEFPSASGVQPAVRWAALGAGDSVDAGLDPIAPLQSASIVIDRGGELMDAAASLQRTLAQRGIPSGITSDVIADRDPQWSDSTEYANPNDDLRSGSGMRIILGGPEQNVLAKSVLMQVPESAMAAFNARIAAGVTMYLEDAYVGEGLSPAPTLILAGAASGASAQQAMRFGAALQERGRLQIPKELFITRAPQHPEDGGVAVLIPGPFLFSTEADGSMVTLLAHGSDGEASALGGDTGTTPIDVRYAFFPFAGRWHDAALARASHAFAEPLQSVVTDLHVARQPVSLGLVTLDNSAIAATAIKPAETPEAAGSSRETRPANGVLLRAYESAGQVGHSEGAANSPLRGMYISDVVEGRGAQGDVDVNRFTVPFKPFEIKNIVLVPSTRSPQGDATSLEGERDIGPHLATHWRQNRWIASTGAIPVGLAFEGSLGEAETEVRLHIVNHSSDMPRKGAVTLSAPQDWRLSTTSVAYDLKPRGTHVETIVVLRKFPADKTGGIVATTDVDGVQYYDLLQLDPQPCAVETEVSGTQITVLVRNTGALPLMCRVEAMASPSLWTELYPSRDTTLEPRIHTATIPAQGEERFTFTATGARPGTRVVVKVGANATVSYHGVELP